MNKIIPMQKETFIKNWNDRKKLMDNFGITYVNGVPVKTIKGDEQ